MTQVLLRKPRAGDIAEVRRAYRRSRELHHPYTSAPEDFSAYLQQPHRYFVCVCDTAEIAGTFNLSCLVRGLFQSAFLGYEAFAPYHNRGMMTAGLRLLIAEAFGELNLHRLEANIQPSNRASIRLVAKAGFVREGYSRNYLRINGQWCDHERWALVNDAWREPF